MLVRVRIQRCIRIRPKQWTRTMTITSASKLSSQERRRRRNGGHVERHFTRRHADPSDEPRRVGCAIVLNWMSISSVSFESFLNETCCVIGIVGNFRSIDVVDEKFIILDCDWNITKITIRCETYCVVLFTIYRWLRICLDSKITNEIWCLTFQWVSTIVIKE